MELEKKSNNTMELEIEKLAKDFVSAYNSGDNDELVPSMQSFLRGIDRNEYQFRMTTHTYFMAKALYYLMLQENQELITDDEYDSIIKLAYYCLLKHYYKSNTIPSSDIQYEELVNGSKMLFVLIVEYFDYLKDKIMIETLLYFPSHAFLYLRNQILLLGGTVKESIENQYHFFSDEKLNSMFNECSQDLFQQLPTGELLKDLKEEALPVIKDIYTNLENLFMSNNWDNNFF